VREAHRLGFEYVGVTGTGHFKFRHPEHGLFFMSNTPSCHHVARNNIRLMHRKVAGLHPKGHPRA
jgi:hypothetical protein